MDSQTLILALSGFRTWEFSSLELMNNVHGGKATVLFLGTVTAMEELLTTSWSSTAPLCLGGAQVKQGNPVAFLANLYQAPSTWDPECPVPEIYLPAY